MKKQISAALCAAMMLAGCQAAPAPGKDSSTEVSSMSSQKPTQAAALSDSEKLSIFDFSWKLFEQTRNEKTDSLLSPLSAFFALGMAANGADGATLEEIEQAIGLNLDTVNSLSAAAIETAKGENRQLSIANSVWVKDVMPLADFQSVLKTDYAAEGYPSDFSDKAVKDINDWVSKQTDGQIKEIVTKEALTDAAVLLLNALNFDAKWEQPYEDGMIDTFAFTDAQGEQTDTECLMSQEAQYLDAGGLEGFMKPYENGRYAFAALIPKDVQSSLDEQLAGLDSGVLEAALKNPQTREVNAVIPSFMLEDEKALSDAFKALGIVQAFEDSADFSKMAQTPLKLSQVLQKTRIQVDAQGTKAAATTSMIAVPTSAPVDEEEPVMIVCDRPFLYLIVDWETGTPVFIGTQQSAPGKAQ